VAPRYHVRERIFVGWGPNLTKRMPVYSADDLSADECEMLEKAVQRYLNELDEHGGHGPWGFELAPSVADDNVAFINLKAEWEYREQEIAECAERDNSWRGEIRWMQRIADEQAEVIRDLRVSELVTVYLQCDWGRGYRTFARVDSLTEDETLILEDVLDGELYDMGMKHQMISDVEAERQPALYVRAVMDWDQLQEDEKRGEVDDNRGACGVAAEEAVAQILKLRLKPVVYGGAREDDEEEEILPKTSQGLVSGPVNGNGDRAQSQRAADPALRHTYHDPDNYERNVWLYERRKAGLTNAVILAALTQEAARFAPLETENALRTAIDQIAAFHGWPELKGRAGRPRGAKMLKGPEPSGPETPQSISETPQ